MAVPEAKVEEAVAATAVPRVGRASGILSVLLKGLGLTLVVAVGTLAGQFLYGLLGHAERVPAAHDAADAGKQPVKAEVKKKAPEGPPVAGSSPPVPGPLVGPCCAASGPRIIRHWDAGPLPRNAHAGHSGSSTSPVSRARQT